MRFVDKRCVHCQTVYTYQESGWCVIGVLNDPKHCRDCKSAILDALDKVPVKYERVWVETDELTFDELQSIREICLERERRQYPNRVIGERMVAPLYNLKDPENRHVSHIVRCDDVDYLIEMWSKDPDSKSVKKECERNIETGEIRPWRNYGH